MRALRAVGAVPRLALPVDEVPGRDGLGHALPPDGPVVLVEHDIREDGVLACGGEGVRVGLCARAGRDAEEAVLRVHGPEPPVLAGAQPRDVVADGPALPAVLAVALRRDEHGEVRLAAGGRERAGHVADLALRVLDAEDEHVLGEPALLPAQHGRDAQREALLALQDVAAVVGVQGDDLVLLREVDDVAVFGVELRLGVHARDEIFAVAQRVEHGLAHAGHDRHVQHDVNRIGQLNAVLGEFRADRAHGIGDHVHGAPGHRAAQDLVDLRLHLVGVHPVVRGAGVLPAFGADERSALHARHVVHVAAVEIAAGQLLLVELNQLAGLHRDPAQGFQLLLRAVDPHDFVRLGKLGSLAHALQHQFVLRQFHCGSPFTLLVCICAIVLITVPISLLKLHLLT